MVRFRATFVLERRGVIARHVLSHFSRSTSLAYPLLYDIAKDVHLQ